MARSALLALAVAFALVGATRSSSNIIPLGEKDLSSEESLRSLYERWRSHYHSTVSKIDLVDEKEKLIRFNVFKDNAKFIHEFNQNKDETYKLNLNKFADLSNEEFLNKYTGLKMQDIPKRSGNEPFMYENTPNPPPASFDWRTKGAVGPIKHQGQCGSCWAFTATTALEAINQIMTNELITLSEQELVDCTTANRGCDRGSINNAYDYIIKNGGISSNSAYPYTAEQGSCASKENSPVVTLDGYEVVPTFNETALMNAVANQVVTVLIKAIGTGFQFYSEGVLSSTPCDISIDHSVALVGYGATRDGIKYWIAKNSWGDDWGESGYIRMERDIDPDSGGTCCLALYPVYPIKTSTNPIPTMEVLSPKDEL